MAQSSANSKSLFDLATVKYGELKAIDHSIPSARRLKLAMPDATPEIIDSVITNQLALIANRIGSDLFASMPAAVLEQFAVMAITRGHDGAGMISDLISSFMVAYQTPETSAKAIQHLIGLKGLRTNATEVNNPVPAPVLKAYQVGETDIVAAYDPAGAIETLQKFNGDPSCTFDLDEVNLISDDMLDCRTGYDNDEKEIVVLEQTLREQMAELTEPGYLHGWE